MIRSSVTPTTVAHGLRRHSIVRWMLEAVFRGELRSGQRLVVQQLAAQFGVSPTPVREALVELAGIGIVDLLPNRGAVVRRVTGRDVREICQLRRLLECEAVRGACGRIPRGELESLSAELERLLVTPPSPEYAADTRAADSRLHDLVAGACGNSRLASEIGRLKILFRAFRDVGYSNYEQRNDFTRFDEDTRQHLAIVQALLADDVRNAVRLMSRHIFSAVEHWERVITGDSAA